MTAQNCSFCKIINGEVSTPILYHDQQVTAFDDFRPITPVHILVVPNRHIESLNDISAEDDTLLGHMISVAKALAVKKGIDKSGYRLVINTGPHAGQSVFHVHLHLIGGRHMPFRFQ